MSYVHPFAHALVAFHCRCMFVCLAWALNPNSSGAVFGKQVGDSVSGYRVRRINKLDDLELRCIELEHEKTGAQHLHVEADDANNLFRFSALS